MLAVQRIIRRGELPFDPIIPFGGVRRWRIHAVHSRIMPKFEIRQASRIRFRARIIR
jgi:hypothetical protein